MIRTLKLLWYTWIQLEFILDTELIRQEIFTNKLRPSIDS